MPNLCKISRESPRFLDISYGAGKNLKSKGSVTIWFVVVLYPENEFAAFFYLHLSKVLVDNFDYSMQIGTQKGFALLSYLGRGNPVVM